MKEQSLSRSLGKSSSKSHVLKMAWVAQRLLKSSWGTLGLVTAILLMGGVTTVTRADLQADALVAEEEAETDFRAVIKEFELEDCEATRTALQSYESPNFETILTGLYEQHGYSSEDASRIAYAAGGWFAFFCKKCRCCTSPIVEPPKVEPPKVRPKNPTSPRPNVQEPPDTSSAMDSVQIGHALEENHLNPGPRTPIIPRPKQPVTDKNKDPVIPYESQTPAIGSEDLDDFLNNYKPKRD